MTYIVLVLSAVISGFISLVVSLIQSKVSIRRKEKMRVLSTLMAGRRKMTGELFVDAMNSIPLVFANNNKIVSEYNRCYKGIISESLGSEKRKYVINLFNVIVEDSNLFIRKRTRDNIKKAFIEVFGTGEE